MAILLISNTCVFSTLLKEQLVRLHPHLGLTFVDLDYWNFLWEFVSLWETAVRCIQVLEYVGVKKNKKNHLSLQDDALHLYTPPPPLLFLLL